MYRSKGYLLSANRVKAAEARDNAAALQAENLPANRDKLLPANGAWFESGHGKGPGVNSTFTAGISQTDLNNLRAGKTLYNFSPAKIVRENRHVLAGHLVPAHAYPTPIVNQIFLSNRSISLYQMNDELGRITQQSAQEQHRNFNIAALTDIAVFVGAGVAGAALGGTSAATAGGSAATTGGSVAATTTAANEAASASLLSQLGTGASDLAGGLSAAAGIKNEVGTIKGIFSKPKTPAAQPAQQQRQAATSQPQSSFWARLIYYLHYAT